MDYVKRHTRRVAIGIVGGLIVLVGIVLIPYPGPGWLVVFAGFAVLATEFAFARKTLDWLRHKYNVWVEWLKRQHRAVQLLAIALTGCVVLVTIWLLNAPGLINQWLNLGQEWLVSPFFRN